MCNADQCGSINVRSNLLHWSKMLLNKDQCRSIWINSWSILIGIDLYRHWYQCLKFEHTLIQIDQHCKLIHHFLVIPLYSCSRILHFDLSWFFNFFHTLTAHFPPLEILSSHWVPYSADRDVNLSNVLAVEYSNFMLIIHYIYANSSLCMQICYP